MVSFGSNVNLVICQKSKVEDWINHFKTYYEYEKPFCLIHDMTKWKKDDFRKLPVLNKEAHEHAFPHVYVINYDLVWRRKELKYLTDFTLMLDESSLIQNRTAKRTKFILNLNPTNVILLSGTPVSGKYENLWTQIHLLGWDISEKLYNSQYVNWEKIETEGMPVWIPDRKKPYKHVDRLKRKMREHGAYFLKTDECFSLPEQTIIKVECDKPKEYNRFIRNKLVTINGTELVGDSILKERLYLRMICGQYNNSKIQKIRELFESTNDRLLVFYNFNSELEILIGLCDELDKPYSQVNGAIKDLDAYENESNSITLIQYQAGAMGLNLQKANRIIYFTLTEKSELFEQSKKRIHRIGQKNSCFYYLLLTKGSIEEQIYEALEQKRDYTDELFRKGTKRDT